MVIVRYSYCTSGRDDVGPAVRGVLFIAVHDACPSRPEPATVCAMATDPRAALDRLVGALEAHLLAAQRRRGEQDPAVEAAYKALADAFESYDEALYEAHDEVTPFVLYDDVEDDHDDDDDEEDDDLDVDDEADDLDEDDDDEDEDSEGAAAEHTTDLREPLRPATRM
jgi:hypothetical protein